jgi:carboxypeptidase C (cathepsin A)
MAKADDQGRYLPLFASAVSDGNLNLKKHGKTEINLQSVMIGNGITDLCESNPDLLEDPSLTWQSQLLNRTTTSYVPHLL